MSNWVTAALAGLGVFLAITAAGLFVLHNSRDSAGKTFRGRLNLNRRILYRFTGGGKALLFAADGGPDWRFDCRLVDLSEFGARVTARQAVPEGSVVRIELADLRLTVGCWVRRCQPAGRRFDLGLEFRGTAYPTIRKAPPIRHPEFAG
jgi:hypothetical protein